MIGQVLVVGISALMLKVALSVAMMRYYAKKNER